MTEKHMRKLVFTALFTALTCVATMIIKIPSPTGGYVHPGDAVVLLSAFLLGPLWGAFAAGFGSLLAELLSGYIIYAPGTLVIKALMAVTAGVVLKRNAGRKPLAAAVLAGLAAEPIMIAGYFIYTATVIGAGWGALASIPGDLAQAVFGIAAGSALFLALRRIPEIRRMFDL